MNSENERRAAGFTTADAEEFADLLAPGHRLIGIDAGTKTLGLALSDVTRTSRLRARDNQADEIHRRRDEASRHRR